MFTGENTNAPTNDLPSASSSQIKADTYCTSLLTILKGIARPQLKVFLLLRLNSENITQDISILTVYT